ncbi:MAG TPA: glucose-6-phosphate isomerase [Verrucomicrobiales bacterium]|nr:glucose-6-phosphate isomerase [Verrucomicrobiales bacterium]
MSGWKRYGDWLVREQETGLWLDVSRMGLDEAFLERMEEQVKRAFADMRQLEAGEIANPDEERMVGHYWLRAPELAPNEALARVIREDREACLDFAGRVACGDICGEGGQFREVLLIGIGGSALGPQLAADALRRGTSAMETHYFDNTDPDGFDRVLDGLRDRLGETLTVVISKSGGTEETRNGMLEAAAAYRAAGLDFARHAAAVTGEGSALDREAEGNGWLARFRMHDWVGGRTSVTSVVGLLPMALQGIDTGAFLEGAASMDRHTRSEDPRANAAMLMALAWHQAGEGRGAKDMVILPYKDRLLLLSRYLQQLVMESLGKDRDRDGGETAQGITVYGNKGSTDQHAFVQQLCDGVNNFFVTFVEARRARQGNSLEVKPGATSGDYLQGFLRGTRRALTERGRQSVTLSIPEVEERSLGALIALFERAVGFYASLVNINAYHQPGVQAGKTAASSFLTLLGRARAELTGSGQEGILAAELARGLGEDPEDVFHALHHLAANGSARCRLGLHPAEDRFVGLP